MALDFDEAVPREAAFRELEASAFRNRFVPICGPQAGRFLFLACRAARARRALDVGTAIGYSALWLSRAVGPRGRVTSVELDARLAAEARENLRRARARNVNVVEGDAQDVVPRLRGRWDAVFLDHAKSGYLPLLPHAARLLRPGGVLFAHNVAWPELEPFNRALLRHPAFDATLLPLPEGLAFAVRK